MFLLNFNEGMLDNEGKVDLKQEVSINDKCSYVVIHVFLLI